MNTKKKGKGCLIVILVFAVLSLFGACFGSSDSSETETTAVSSSSSAETEAEKESEAASEAENTDAETAASGETDSSGQAALSEKALEVINTYMDDSGDDALKTAVKKLSKENPDALKAGLTQRMSDYMTDNSSGSWNSFDNRKMKKYCELYQAMVPDDTAQTISAALAELESTQKQKDNLPGLDYEDRSFSPDEADSLLDYGSFYVTQRLEMNYSDTIIGGIQKEVDNLKDSDISYWVAYDVTYTLGTAFPGDTEYVICANYKNPFPASGAYDLSYLTSSRTMSLTNSQGFTWEVPVYYLVSDVETLYEQISESQYLDEQIDGQIRVIRQALGIRDTMAEALAALGIWSDSSVYSCSWQSSTTGYFLIPSMDEAGNPGFIVTVENSTSYAATAFYIDYISLEGNEDGGYTYTGRIYSATKEAEPESVGTCAITWASPESVDFFTLEMIESNEKTDLSVVADDYAYYGLIV